jgi:hypothetical protein
MNPQPLLTIGTPLTTPCYGFGIDTAAARMDADLIAGAQEDGKPLIMTYLKS